MIELHRLQGKTIGIVYIFEAEKAQGIKNYPVWQSDVIDKLLKVIRGLRCRPLALDARTFVQKAMCGTLPIIDYVVNLNCGVTEFFSIASVPSICGFLHIPCISLPK